MRGRYEVGLVTRVHADGKQNNQSQGGGTTKPSAIVTDLEDARLSRLNPLLD